MNLSASRLIGVLLALVITGDARWVAAQPAQPVVSVGGPPASSQLRHLTPTFTILASGFQESDPVVTLRLQIAAQSDFSAPLFVDTTVVPDAFIVRLARPLPQGTPLHWRAIARTASGAEFTSAAIGPGMTASWLTLVSPNEPNGSALTSRQPVLTWTSATVDDPPGPWVYEVAITNAATRQIVVSQSVADTSFAPAAPLETNTPYRWRVTGRLGTTDSVTRESASTFVIADTDAPLATLLYQSFPNPFPTASAQRACIWFDLHRPSLVTLDVFDIRGRRVRQLIPNVEVSSALRAGRYGRESGSTDTGCDPRFSWDGNDEDGRVVPAGVYLVRLRAADQELVKKILFRGR